MAVEPSYRVFGRALPLPAAPSQSVRSPVRLSFELDDFN
jgi:hypothetical protein